MRAWPVLALVVGCGRLDFADVGRVDGSVAPDVSTIACADVACADMTFGVDGVSIIDVGGVTNSAFGYHGIAVAPDGKLVLVGKAGVPSSPAGMVVRLTDSGALDPSFGTGGVAMPMGSAQLISINTDVGSVLSISGTAPANLGYVGVLDDAGALVPQLFGGAGYTTDNFGSTGAVACNGVVLGGGGHMFAGGQAQFTGNGFDIFVGHWDASGSLWAPAAVRPYAQAMDQFGAFAGFGLDGGIETIGQSFNGSNFDGLILRSNPGTGELLSTFANGGVLIEGRPGKSERFAAMTHDSAGRIVAVGVDRENDSIPADILVARYANDGTPDVDFGTNGLAILDLGADETARSVIAWPDGRTIVGVRSTEGGVERSRVLIVSDKGVNLGAIDVPVGVSPNGLDWMVRDQQGRLVVLGDTGNEADIYVARLVIP